MPAPCGPDPVPVELRRPMVPEFVLNVTCPCPVADWTAADCGALAFVLCRSISP